MKRFLIAVIAIIVAGSFLTACSCCDKKKTSKTRTATSETLPAEDK